MADTSFIIWIQQFSSPLLDSIFKAITFLGDEEYYILSIPLLFWLYDKKFGFRFGIFFLLNAYLNSFLKFVFTTTRPPLELHKIDQGGYSFPSGHAQGNTAFWGYLAWQVRKRWAIITGAFIFSLVAFSRVYLGVHFPIDIIFGILFGLAWLALYEFLWKKLNLKLNLWQWLLGSAVLTALMLLIHPVRETAEHIMGDAPLTAGFILGALWGYRLEGQFVGFREKANWKQNVVKTILGLVVLLLIKELGKPVILSLLGGPAINTPLELTATGLRYFLLGIWVTLGAPWLFKALKLEKKEEQKIAA